MNYYCAWLLEIASFCAVNCFAMISGFCMVESNHKFSKFLPLWLQVSFYCVVIALFFILVPNLNTAYGVKDVVKAAFPIRMSSYWYFSAYFPLFFLVPFVNKMLLDLDRKQFQLLLVVVFMIFSIIPTMADEDLYWVHHGYSFLWLILMYFFGAYVKRFPIKICVKKFIACFLLSTLFCFILFLFKKIPVFYTSPFVVLNAFLLVILFSKIHLSNSVEKIVRFFAPMSFAVYLIHTNKMIWTYFFVDAFKFLKDLETGLLIIFVLAISASIYLFCSMIDYCRIKVFALLRVNALTKKIVEIESRYIKF